MRVFVGPMSYDAVIGIAICYQDAQWSSMNLLCTLYRITATNAFVQQLHTLEGSLPKPATPTHS